MKQQPRERQPSLLAGEPTPQARQLGYVHVYYGGGKGKTTAAIGLAVRALGAGYRVRFIQFDKGHDPERGEHYSERVVLRRLEGLELEVTGCERIQADGSFRFGVEQADRAEAERGLGLAQQAVSSGRWDLVVLDEILGALAYGLVEESEVLAVLDAHAAAGRRCELVLTGHKLTDAIKERADLVTHMRKIKHYFDRGVPARLGIEF
ncbi:MAG: cob(I)alamin adenosyltransferase [Planctomycetota bacterium]|nr:MAG: cob(I)alamin adenosyltransferase [Planctomycetota bacterium]